MDAMETILTRRSVRRFTDQDVSREQVEALLRAAMQAPSAGNSQPWHFVVIREQVLREAIPEFSPFARMILEAPAGILVCGDLQIEKYPKQQYWVQDCAAATENILLAAHASGLGAVWTAVYPMRTRMDGFRELLALPEHIVPFAFVPVGHPLAVPEPENRYRPDRVHFDGW